MSDVTYDVVAWYKQFKAGDTEQEHPHYIVYGIWLDASLPWPESPKIGARVEAPFPGSPFIVIETTSHGEWIGEDEVGYLERISDGEAI